MNDHREFERLFEQLRTEPDSRPSTVPVLTTLLAAHSRAEEAEAYPAARDEAGIAHDVAHSQEEHIEADRLLAKLRRIDPTSPEFEPALDEVIKAVTHHLEEEESSVLPAMRDRLGVARLEELGSAFLSTRAEHLGEQPEDITKAELEQQAANADLAGASQMDKAELSEALQQQAASSE